MTTKTYSTGDPQYIDYTTGDISSEPPEEWSGHVYGEPVQPVGCLKPGLLLTGIAACIGLIGGMMEMVAWVWLNIAGYSKGKGKR